MKRTILSCVLQTSAVIVGGWFLLLGTAAEAQHTRPDNQATQITDQHRADIVDSLCRTLNEVYIFADVAIEMETYVRSNLSSGAYADVNTLSEFTERLTEDFQSVSKDLHLRVGASHMTEIPRDDPEEQQRRMAEHQAMLKANNYQFKKIEILPGNIGYLRFDGFVDAEHGGATAVAAMNFLANVDAIIFDVRYNGGGSPSMIQLITSYLLKEATHINSFYIRREDTTTQFWTQAHVSGPKLVDVPAYVLTSGRTFSAAEEFTYNLKNLERATIVGQTTGGGAHPVEGHWFRIDEGLFVEASIPFGRAVNPITGTNWEGTGIEPHIQVPEDKALIAAQKDFLEKTLETTDDEARRMPILWSLKGIEVELNPVVLDMTEAKQYVGSYGPRTIGMEDGQLFYQRQDRPRHVLIPMGDDTFGLQGLDSFRLRFERNEQGSVDTIVGMYSNGRRDQNKRVES
jgi:C-terminal processing protease CtpA/Prc